ncbi:MAG: efflux RND transporter periplasmic adaptor subunit [Proteobacteria bacterium]|uniref:efflux RND transporter periplasmic adaptor subunit n=1 Tax=Zoogloea sp. LCSB751 TaxID=1965277 RepID=UPI0009A4F22E|nr:efflux RND transporter periplasmic adaptor subunit [Zoogloea sp. LCSB751]MBS0349335.1 efflux RND transporter periplasmic adaptor subunit [Pseudomonadota bacterium]
MKTGAGIAVGLAVALAAGGGYWLGQRPSSGHEPAASPVAAAPMDGAKKERKLLYYRNPMGLPDTSPTPKKDPMGMDYIPVYEGEADDEPAAANAIKISTDKVQKLGVRTEAAELRSLDRTVRAAGRVEIDERRSFAISPKFEGYVERLHVNVTGQPVAQGQPLFEVYSPELVSAQREYAIAAQGVDALKDAGSEAQSGMKQLAESSLLRLRNWDISEEQIRALAKSGATKRTLTFRSPVAGVVTEKKALQGMRFMPGDTLYQVADLSSVWVIADVFEQDIGLVRSGSLAKVRINAYPDKVFEGKVSYVYPTLNAETRTVAVRVELPNPGQLLKPAMFAQVEVPVEGKGQVVTVPSSAVIDSGTRQIVLVAHGEGRFEPRDVKLGGRSENHIEVMDGVKAGEKVVVAANFLIDAESNLKAAVGGFGHSGHGGAPKSGKDGEKPAAAPQAAGHRAEGTVGSVDAKDGTVSLSHGPVASLKWPAMTMEFKVANPSLLQALKPGVKVDVEFVERQPGEWVITSATPAGKAAPSAPAANPHAGH